MPKYNIHRVNFYNFIPNAIHCLSYDESTAKLAVSRADFSIEIWDLSNTPFQERVIAPISGSSVESLCWCKSRLFSTGLLAYVSEYDLCTLSEKSTSPVIGGPAWCLASNKDQTILAAGTEEGYVCLFTVDSEDFSFLRRFDKQEGRILCLSWHASGKTLVTGSVDSIRVWNVENGHAVNRITVGRLKKGTETIVWCLAILQDFTIVSGDSCGRTSFWNGHSGTLISSSKVHKADVLCLTVSKNEEFVYTSGIDPVIFQFAKVLSGNKTDSKAIWVKSVQRVLHTHDVRAITIAAQFLVSGGVDSHLVLSTYPPKMCLKYAPVKQTFCAHVSCTARCLLLQYPKCLEIWRLGSSSHSDGNDGDVLRLFQKETKALLLNCPEGEHIVCSTLSDDGKWLAYSTNDQMRLYNFILEEDPLTLVPMASLQKIRWIPEECRLAHLLAFTFSGKFLLISTPVGTLQVMETNLIQPCLVHTFSGPSQGKDRISIMACSRDDSKCAAADHIGNVTLYDLQKLEVHCRMPHYKCQATSMVFNPQTANLIVAYADHKIVEYDVTNKCYLKVINALLKCNPFYPILRMGFAGENPSRLFLQDDNTVYAFEEGSGLTPLHSSKRTKTVVAENETNDSLKSTKKFKHLLAFTNLCANEFVAVELTPETILESLPPALRRKKFGT